MSLLPQEIRYNRKFKYTRLDVGIMIDVTDFGKKEKKEKETPLPKKIEMLETNPNEIHSWNLDTISTL